MTTHFADLRVRSLSAAAMLALGAAAIWLGGAVFGLLSIGLAGLMTWELHAMTQPRDKPNVAEAQGVAAAILVAVMTYFQSGLVSVIGLAAGVAILAWRVPRDRAIYGGYLLLILLSVHGLIVLRSVAGIAGLQGVLWLVAIVVTSDVMGYFAGRLLGGPKFWPRISPKKTWSGTVAGWLGAALVGYGFGLWTGVGLIAVPLSVFLAMAGQLGDIAESAIKRRAGVKDSSALIPGHGGVLDRFDALIAVSAVALVLFHLAGLTMAQMGAFGGVSG